MKPTQTPEIKKGLYTPMLSIGGNNIYQRPITDGLWTILSRAQEIAAKNKEQLIQNGYNLTLPIQGKPRGQSPVTGMHPDSIQCVF